MKKLCLSMMTATLAFGLFACDEGQYNDLTCDPNTYKAECLDVANYMFCDPAGQTDESGNTMPGLVVRECATGQACSNDHATAENPSLCK